MEILARDLHSLPENLIRALGQIREFDRVSHQMMQEIKEEEHKLIEDFQQVAKTTKPPASAKKEKTTGTSGDGENENDHDDKDDGMEVQDGKEREKDEDKDKETEKNEVTDSNASQKAEESTERDSPMEVTPVNPQLQELLGSPSATKTTGTGGKTNTGTGSAPADVDVTPFVERFQQINRKRQIVMKRLEYQVNATQAIYDYIDAKCKYLTKTTAPIQSLYPEELLVPGEGERRKKKKKRNSEEVFVDPNEPLYCYCQQISYGEMVACENSECKIEWFHFPCVNLTEAPSDPWYCPTCSASMHK